jgi:cell division protein FtsQ
MKRSGLPVGGLDVGELPLNGAPDDAPFLRPEKRMKVRRGRRGVAARAILTLRLSAVIVVGVAAVWTGYAKTMASDRLKVGRVEVRGSRFLSEGEVRELLGPAVGENILGLDIAALKARLRSSPWVADATVGRTLPDTLKVEITERVPLALAEVERLYLMDKNGGLIDLYGPRTASFDLPIVRGLMGVDAEARRDRAERAGALLDDLGDLAAEVSEVFVLPTGDLKIVLRGTGEVLLVGEPPNRQRVLTYLSLRKDLVERCPDAEYFDLRFRGRIYAKHPVPPPAEPRPPVAPRPVAPKAGGAALVATPAAIPQPSPSPAITPSTSAAADPSRDDQGR